MGWYGERVVPRLVDRSLRGPEIGELRAVACAGLRGAVLELGFGSGLNAPYYPAAVDAVDAVEPSDLAWQLSQRRREGLAVPVDRAGMDGQRIQADAASYDAVLSTFTFCTIPDLPRALAEVRRVLRPGGTLHFLEHGRAPSAGVRRWQRRIEPVQRRLAGGCHLTRDVPRLIADAGLELRDLEQVYLPGPAVSRPWAFVSTGRAS